MIWGSDCLELTLTSDFVSLLRCAVHMKLIMEGDVRSLWLRTFDTVSRLTKSLHSKLNSILANAIAVVFTCAMAVWCASMKFRYYHVLASGSWQEWLLGCCVCSCREPSRNVSFSKLYWWWFLLQTRKRQLKLDNSWVFLRPCFMWTWILLEWCPTTSRSACSGLIPGRRAK